MSRLPGFPQLTGHARPPRRRRTGPALVSALALTLAMVACSEPAADPDSADGEKAGSVSGERTTEPTPEPTPTEPPPLTADQFAAEIAADAEDLDASLAGVAAAESLKGLRRKLDAAQSAAARVRDRMDRIDLPDEVRDPASQFYFALDDLEGQLSDAAGSGESSCKAPAPLSTLIRSIDFTALRDAIASMKAADYPVGVSIPKRPKQPNRRLDNGTYLESGSRTGADRFLIKNGGSSDALVALALGDSKDQEFSVYVRKNAEVEVGGVVAGTYTAYSATGIDFSRKHNGFTRDCVFTRFDETFTFSGDGGGWEITLYEVVGGNLPSSEVGAGEFPG